MTGENVVDIDPQALEAEALSVEAALVDGVPQDGTPIPAPEPTPAEAAAQELATVQAAAAGWRPGAEFMVNALSDAIAPNWGITAEERRDVVDGIAMGLAAWFPDEVIPLKFVVLLQGAGAVWKIITARRDANGGKLPPLRLAHSGEGAATNSSPAPAPRAGGAVTTSA